MKKKLNTLNLQLEFPEHTIFCHPDDEQYFKDRCKDDVNILTSKYILRNQFVKSKDLHIKYSEPEIGWDKDDFENNKITVRCHIESVEVMK